MKNETNGKINKYTAYITLTSEGRFTCVGVIYNKNAPLLENYIGEKVFILTTEGTRPPDWFDQCGDDFLTDF